MKRNEKFDDGLEQKQSLDVPADGGSGDACEGRACAPLPPPQAAAMEWSATLHSPFSSIENQVTDNPVPLVSTDSSLLIPLVPNQPTVLDDVPKWKILSQGMDTLDLGFGIFWGDGWDALSEEWEEKKKEAAGKNEILWRKIHEESVYICPSGKPPMYRYHLETEWGHVYIGKTASPRKDPNVYVSFYAWRLWQDGWRKCLVQTAKMFRALGGRIRYIKPSRVDLCIDCHVPSGMTKNFILTHLVALSRKWNCYCTGGTLETFYLSNKKNAVQLRIYDKTLKATKDGILPLFWGVWKAQPSENVWRFEFQMRRPFLHQWKIETIADLQANVGTLWKHLTEDWCSLRLPDNPNQTRRTVHPFWADIQNRASFFGGMRPLSRETKLEQPDMAWHVAHIEGCLTTFGAMRGDVSIDEALQDLTDVFHKRKPSEVYDAAIQLKAFKTGRLGASFKKGTSAEGKAAS